jgi:hypothetical protein
LIPDAVVAIGVPVPPGKSSVVNVPEFQMNPCEPVGSLNDPTTTPDSLMPFATAREAFGGSIVVNVRFVCAGAQTESRVRTENKQNPTTFVMVVFLENVEVRTDGTEKQIENSV